MGGVEGEACHKSPFGPRTPAAGSGDKRSSAKSRILNHVYEHPDPD